MKWKRFKTSFDYFSTKELQKVGVSCLLRSKFNWFKKRNKITFWGGSFKCIDKNCKNCFDCEIKTINKDNGVDVFVNWCEYSVHQILIHHLELLVKLGEFFCRN